MKTQTHQETNTQAKQELTPHTYSLGTIDESLDPEKGLYSKLVSNSGTARVSDMSIPELIPMIDSLKP